MEKTAKSRILNDISTPFLAVERQIVEGNVAEAEKLFSKKYKWLRPHFKTHRTPELLLMQTSRSVCGVTCATVGEAELALEAGIKDILIANTFASANKINRIADMATKAKITVGFDSEEHIRLLSRTGAPVNVLLEIDTGLHRCGISDIETACRLADTAVTASGIRFAGIMGYEGRFRKSAPGRDDKIRDAYSLLEDTKRAIENEGIKVGIVSAAGTSTLLEALNNAVITEIQAGSYVLMEPEIMDLGLPFQLAAYVVATVVSTASGHVVLDIGRRSVSYEYGLPICLDPRGKVARLNDEHAILEWKGTLPPIGARISLRPTQNRTTFNLHDDVWLVGQEGSAERIAVKARGMSS